MQRPTANPSLRRPSLTLGPLVFVLVLLGIGAGAAQAETTNRVVLHLKNGDRLAGKVLKESADSVSFATDWGAEISIPAPAIAQRELPGTATANPSSKPVITKGPGSQVAANPKGDKIKGNARLGLDFLNGRRNRQTYYGRFKTEYEHPYQTATNQFFRATLDYTADFGETDGRRSANRMDAVLKSDFDLSPRIYTYDLVDGGYDEIRKVDYSYEVGPGLGYHLIRRPTLKLDLESGFNYQAQSRMDSDDVNDFNWRLGQRLHWKAANRVTISQSLEIAPRVVNPDIFTSRLDANFAYALTESLSLNLSVLDLYDTKPAKDVNRNELQLRSSLGVTF